MDNENPTLDDRPFRMTHPQMQWGTADRSFSAGAVDERKDNKRWNG